MGGESMSDVLEYSTDLDQVLKERIKRIESQLGHAGLTRIMSVLLGKGHGIAVKKMRERGHMHKTGETEKFEILRDGDLAGRVSAISKVVGYLEWGTPSLILPENGEFLYFENLQGELIRKRSVKGIAAQHNLRDLVLPAEDRMIREEVDNACKKAVG
jgi:hypothetical protein